MYVYLVFFMNILYYVRWSSSDIVYYRNCFFIIFFVELQ